MRGIDIFAFQHNTVGDHILTNDQSVTQSLRIFSAKLNQGSTVKFILTSGIKLD